MGSVFLHEMRTLMHDDGEDLKIEREKVKDENVIYLYIPTLIQGGPTKNGNC